MSHLVAVDVAILPPPHVSDRAVALSAALPEADSQGLRLGPDQLPHITLMQLFVREEELEATFEHTADVLRGRPPVPIHVTGGGQGNHSVWMAIERSQVLVDLHEALMQGLRGVERQGGTAAAFADHDARLNDVVWVTTYRLQSSFGAFTPHITLGHAAEPPHVEPIAFEATSIAVCHLGKFCTCRRVLRHWTLPL